MGLHPELSTLRSTPGAPGDTEKRWWVIDLVPGKWWQLNPQGRGNGKGQDGQVRTGTPGSTDTQQQMGEEAEMLCLETSPSSTPPTKAGVLILSCTLTLP